MKKRICLLVILLLSLGLASCRSSAPALTADALKNAEYQSELTTSRKAKLSNGSYKEQAAPGSASQIIVTLSDQIAFGDLNGDRAEDAAVVLISSGGGSGTFYYLAAVLNQKGAPQHAASILLGDRIKLKSVTVKSGEIVVEMTRHGPQDPLCCPTQDVTQKYKLQGDKLVEVK